MLSIVIPVYKNEANIPSLLQEMERIAGASPVAVVLVVDGSPNRSLERLRESLPGRRFSAVGLILKTTRGRPSYLVARVDRFAPAAAVASASRGAR